MHTRPSLLRKIALSYTGYFAMAALIIGLSLITFQELRQIEHKILAGERISEFSDATLEIRRYEKSYFLYGQTGYLEENLAYTAQSIRMLDSYGRDWEALVEPARLKRLRSDLAAYQKLMENYHRQLGSPQSKRLAEQIRVTGKEIVTFGEELAKTERTMLRASLDKSRTFLGIYITLLSLAMIAIGIALWRTVLRPMQHMENCILALAEGRLKQIEIDTSNREVFAITRAFNTMVQELELRQRCLNRSEKLASLGTLLSGVAHELNNPLSNISSSCQILEEELGSTAPPFQREMVAQIDEQTNRARDIVRSLLDFSREKATHKDPVSLTSLVDDTLRFSKNQRPATVTIHTDIPADIVLEADRRRLQQALLNLVKNAVEAVNGNGIITISARLAQPFADPETRFHGPCNDYGPAVDISVADNGSGISAEDLPRVFDPFFTTKDVGQGSGLGLSIVHDIVEEHTGCIAVESQPGQGTVFHIRLPLKAPSSPCAPRPQ